MLCLCFFSLIVTLLNPLPNLLLIWLGLDFRYLIKILILFTLINFALTLYIQRWLLLWLMWFWLILLFLELIMILLSINGFVLFCNEILQRMHGILVFYIRLSQLANKGTDHRQYY